MHTSNTVHPATAYQLHLVVVGGCSLTRGPAGVWEIHPNPARLERVQGTAIDHIPYADQDAAEDFERAFNRAHPYFVGPVAEGHSDYSFHVYGHHAPEVRGAFALYE